MDNEPLRRRSHVEKRITRYQRQRPFTGPMQYVTIVRRHDFRAGYHIIVRPRGSRNHDMVVRLDEPQRPETCIAMGGDSGIAMMPWERSVRDVPGPFVERLTLRSLDNGDSETESRDLENAENVAAMHQLLRWMQGPPHCSPEHRPICVLELPGTQSNPRDGDE